MSKFKFFAFEKGGRAELPPGWTPVHLTIEADGCRQIVIIEAEQDEPEAVAIERAEPAT